MPPCNERSKRQPWPIHFCPPPFLCAMILSGTGWRYHFRISPRHSPNYVGICRSQNADLTSLASLDGRISTMPRPGTVFLACWQPVQAPHGCCPESWSRDLTSFPSFRQQVRPQSTASNPVLFLRRAAASCRTISARGESCLARPIVPPPCRQNFS